MNFSNSFICIWGIPCWENKICCCEYNFKIYTYIHLFINSLSLAILREKSIYSLVNWMDWNKNTVLKNISTITLEVWEVKNNLRHFLLFECEGHYFSQLPFPLPCICLKYSMYDTNLTTQCKAQKSEEITSNLNHSQCWAVF